VNKGNSAGMNGAEVKPIRTRHFQTHVNDMMWRWTQSISIGNNVGKPGTENTFIYTITR
jgi:hypothetical protein